MIAQSFLLELSVVNASRCIRWHGEKGLMDWSPERWLVATMGELGELAAEINVFFDEKTHTSSVKLCAEAADTAIYAELFAQRLGIKLSEVWPDPELDDSDSNVRTMLANCLKELGEAANLLKKVFRIEANLANLSDKDRQIDDVETAKKKIGQHLINLLQHLDDITYGFLEREIRFKFNATSEKYGFPERL